VKKDLVVSDSGPITDNRNEECQRSVWCSRFSKNPSWSLLWIPSSSWPGVALVCIKPTLQWDWMRLNLLVKNKDYLFQPYV